jgi:hypothetical protein
MVCVLLITSIARTVSAEVEVPGLSDAMKAPPVGDEELSRFLSEVLPEQVPLRRDLIERWRMTYQRPQAAIAVEPGDIDSIDAAVFTILRDAEQFVQRDIAFGSEVERSLPDAAKAEWGAMWRSGQRRVWLSAAASSGVLRENYHRIVDVIEATLSATRAEASTVDAAIVAESEVDQAILRFKSGWPRERATLVETVVRARSGEFRDLPVDETQRLIGGEAKLHGSLMKDAWSAARRLHALLPDDARTDLLRECRRILAPELEGSRVLPAVVASHRDQRPDEQLAPDFAALEEDYIAARNRAEESYADAVLKAWDRHFSNPRRDLWGDPGIAAAVATEARELRSIEKRFIGRLREILERLGRDQTPATRLAIEWARLSPE